MLLKVASNTTNQIYYPQLYMIYKKRQLPRLFPLNKDNINKIKIAIFFSIDS